MQKSPIFLVIVSSLIVVGIILSFYGAQLTTQNLTVKEEKLVSGSSFEIMTELDLSKGETGVYGILVENFEKDAISVTVIDPLGNQITSKIVDEESIDEQFKIDSSGRYKLVIENSGLKETQIVAGVGHMPDNSAISVGITGFFILIMGLSGIVAIGIYTLRNRRKQRLS
jgi:hypothetical protein